MEKFHTVDEAELAHFKTYSDLWWSKESPMKSLLSMNKLRVPFVKEGLFSTGKIDNNMFETPKPLQNLKILDAGCGAGYLTEALARFGAKVTGVDPCKELCDSAVEHAKLDKEVEQNVEYVLDSIENHSVDNKEKYDAVVSSEVLEHVPSPRIFLEALIKTVKPGGSIYVTTINRTYYSWFAGIILAENVFRYIPKGSHEWDKFVQPSEVQQICEENNCEVKEVRGMFYNFLFNTWYWSPNKSLNYALHAVKKQ